MPPEQDPEVQGVPVTAGHWQDPPVNRWAFWHVPEILPTYRVARGRGPARRLPRSPATADLSAIPVTRADGSAGTVSDVLAGTFTDAYVVLQDGELVTEWYGPRGAADRTHALMSVSKSVIGCVAAILIDRGQLDADGEITGYIPELAGSGYAGATVRHVLDMRSGVRFTEEYADSQADIRRLDEWIGWQPSGPEGGACGPEGEPRGLYRFLATVPAEAPHGGRFLYRSVESDVLGWACERAAGQSMTALVSDLLWAPMGAEHDADLLHDGLGAAVHDGGLCATARDVARFGQLLLDGGAVPGGPGGQGGSAAEGGAGGASAGDSLGTGGEAAPAARRAPAASCRRSGCARAGPSTPTCGPPSPRRPPKCRSPAAGTATSSGSARACTAMSCSAWESTARCCTSAAGPTRCASSSPAGRRRRIPPTWRTRCGPSTPWAASSRAASPPAGPGELRWRAWCPASAARATLTPRPRQSA